MHQIDIMVESKRQEWEQQHKALQFQVDRKEREIQKLRELVEHRNKEVLCFQYSNGVFLMFQKICYKF